MKEIKKDGHRESSPQSIKGKEKNNTSRNDFLQPKLIVEQELFAREILIEFCFYFLFFSFMTVHVKNIISNTQDER